MQLRYEIQLAAMLKAMREVVIPAIDPAHRLAVEQSQLIVGMLSLMRQQLPLQFAFDRDELRRLVHALAGIEVICETDPALHSQCAAQRAARLAAQEVLEHCTVDPAALHQNVRELRARIDELVAIAATQTGADTFRRLEKEVLELSREQLLRDRAWVAMQGWEPDAKALPPIDQLLSGGSRP